MHKEDEDVVSHLRQYRPYIGQGIPDPWLIYSHFNNPEIFPHLKSTQEILKHSKNKRERCMCLEKEFLFECPDKCTANTQKCCTSHNCCRKNLTIPDSGESCKCSKIFNNWLSNLKQTKKQVLKGCSRGDISSQNYSYTDSECEISQEENKFFSYFKNCESNSDSDKSGAKSRDQELNEKHLKLEKRKSERKHKNKKEKILIEQSKVCFCPCIRHLCQRKYFSNNGLSLNFVEPKMSMSKEIQTEIEPLKFSKIVQTEKMRKKVQQLKCTCLSKCLCYNICQCPSQWIERGCTALHTTSCNCLANCNQKPTIMCPCSISNKFINQKPYKYGNCNSKRHFRKKKQLEKDQVNELKFHRLNLKSVSENIDAKKKLKRIIPEHGLDEIQSNLKIKSSLNCQRTPQPLNHLKLLSNYKLKYFFQQQRNSPKTSHKTYKSSKLQNYGTGNPSVPSLSQGIYIPHSYYESKFSESSIAERKMEVNKQTQNNLSNKSIRRYNYCNQGTMTVEKEMNDTLPRNCDSTKNFTESKAYSLVKNVRKRRKLLRSKRRKKIFANESSTLQYFLIDPSKTSHSTAEVITLKSWGSPDNLNFNDKNDLLVEDTDGNSYWVNITLKGKRSVASRQNFKNSAAILKKT